MKELLLQYAQYNVWANKLIIDFLIGLDDEVPYKVIPSSFPSLHRTALHLWSAESVWLQRLQLSVHPVWHEDGFTGTFADACREWEQSSAGLVLFTEEQEDDDALKRTAPFHDRQGNPYKMPVYQILQHVCDHSTYHRGQLTSMLRQLGMTDLPQTDFIRFARL